MINMTKFFNLMKKKKNQDDKKVEEIIIFLTAKFKYL